MHTRAAYPRIAVVEHNPAMALLLSYNQERAGVAVECVDNGAVALKQLPVSRPQAVVVD
jgi:DNA-binding response OmpR family regulator